MAKIYLPKYVEAVEFKLQVKLEEIREKFIAGVNL
jgi:hypothetical protein